MKMLIQNSLGCFGMLFLTLATISILGLGCATSRPHDPLAGWTFRQFDDFAPPSGRHHYELDKAITADYQNFISDQHLDLNGAVTGFYEDGTGQHAVAFKADKYGNDVWEYYLFYDKNSKRVKVLKYYKGKYWNP